MGTYIVDYLNANEFLKKERSLKKYNIKAYQKLLFDYYPNIRKGQFVGLLALYNEKYNICKYELQLPTDEAFTKVHGSITLHYSVYENQKTVMLETITPEDILTEGQQKELTTYKGVMISKTHKDLDMFKINLLNSINNEPPKETKINRTRNNYEENKLSYLEKNDIINKLRKEINVAKRELNNEYAQKITNVLAELENIFY